MRKLWQPIGSGSQVERDGGDLYGFCEAGRLERSANRVGCVYDREANTSGRELAMDPQHGGESLGINGCDCVEIEEHLLAARLDAGFDNAFPEVAARHAVHRALDPHADLRRSSRGADHGWM